MQSKKAYDRMFVPLNFVPPLTEEAKIDFYVDVGSSLVFKLKEERNKHKNLRDAFDISKGKAKGYTENRRGMYARRNGMIQTKEFLSLSNSPDFE